MRLRLGIQGKLVGTLILAGLLPLIAALIVLAVWVFRLRVTTIGQSFQAFARQDADNLGILLCARWNLRMSSASFPE